MANWIWFVVYVGVAILVFVQLLRDFRGCAGRWSASFFFGALWLPILFLTLLASGFEVVSKYFKSH